MGDFISSLRGNVSGGLLARVLQSVSSALNKNKRRVPLVGVWWLVGWNSCQGRQKVQHITPDGQE